MGSNVGDIVGGITAEGWPDDSVGCRVGCRFNDGADVVGEAEGLRDGGRVGISVGARLGSTVGDRLGTTVGDRLGTTVGDRLGVSVGD